MLDTPFMQKLIALWAKVRSYWDAYRDWVAAHPKTVSVIIVAEAIAIVLGA